MSDGNISNITEHNLEQFCGSTEYHAISDKTNLVYSDGIKFLMDNGASWLIYLIVSWQSQHMVKSEPFQCWKLSVNQEKSSGIIEADDGNNKIIARQCIDSTNFPLKSIKIFVHNGILMLSTEY